MRQDGDRAIFLIPFVVIAFDSPGCLSSRAGDPTDKTDSFAKNFDAENPDRNNRRGSGRRNYCVYLVVEEKNG